jgi:hypothetical protein
MAKKKKGARSAKRRAALKGFAKGKFQSPVHSNGFKQDMLIDMYGGDKGFTSGYGHPSQNTRAQEALAAGKTYFKHGGTTYKAGSAIDARRGGTVYTATLDARAGKVK